MANGDPFDMEKDYVVATKCFMLAGKDGFTALADSSNERLPPVRGEDDPTIQEITMMWLKNFRKTNAEIDAMPEKAQDAFNKRLEIFKGSRDDRHAESNAIKITPSVDGRLENLGKKVEHDD